MDYCNAARREAGSPDAKGTLTMAEARLLVPRPMAEPPMAAMAPEWADASGPDLLELFRRVWRRKVMIASIAVGCSVVTAAILLIIPPRYTATAQVMLDPSQ